MRTPDGTAAAGWAVLALLELLALAALYWLPTLLAAYRRHPQLGLIAFLNLVGVFVIPWVLALVQVFGEPSRRTRVQR